MSTHLIAGLGNPGPKYARNRHNVGFMTIDVLAERWGAPSSREKFKGFYSKVRVGEHDVVLLKPMTYMNHSGRAVAALCNFYKFSPADLLVAYDELDLNPGVVRLKTGGGHGGHNGLRDICAALGSKDFHRLRIGIGHPGHKDAVVGHVLSRPGKVELQAMEAGLDEALRHWDTVMSGDMQRAMHALHSAT